MDKHSSPPQIPLRSSCGGYNLLMSAIALMVAGVIAVSMVQAYQVYNKHQKTTDNQARVANVVNKIQSFKELYGRFPCPSSLTATRNSPAYGREDCTTVIPTGTCAGGLCVTDGRTISGTPEPIRTGTVPFRLLQMDEKESYDAYGSRLVFSMTQNLGSPATFNDMNGGIGLADETGQSLTTPVGGADFVIISQGPNKIGAYNVTGNQVSPCAGGQESANCIDMAAPPASPTTFVSSLVYLTGGASEFDDTIEYFSSNEIAKWRRNDANRDDIQTISLTNVGVGVTDPSVALDIGQNSPTGAGGYFSATWDGALRAQTYSKLLSTGVTKITQGRVLADSICNEDGTECFRPENFATTGMTPCPAGKYMIGIEGDGVNAKPICKAVRVYCDAPAILTGFNPTTGAPICSNFSTNCIEKNVQICATGYAAFSLKSSNEAGITNPTLTRYKMVVDAGDGIHNVVYKLFDQGSYAPNKAWGEFRCTNGEWIKIGSSGGLCKCSPTAPPNSNCLTSPPSPSCTGTGLCAGAGTGSSSIAYTFDATTCVWSGGVPNYSACTCSGTPTSPAPALGPCGAGYNTGNSPGSYAWNAAPNICAWVPGPGTCACNPANALPPASSNGEIRTSTLPADTVACNTITGFAGFSGNAYKRYRFNGVVGACAWQFLDWDTSACTCDTSTLHPEPAVTTCNLACQNETGGATNWYKYTMPGCTKTLDHSDPSVCVDKTFTWQIDPASPPLTGQSSHGPIEVGDNCNQTCLSHNDVGSTSACWTPDAGGKFKIYSCICKP